MDRKNENEKSSQGSIMAVCPDCKGTGKVPPKPYFKANPKAPLTRPDRRGLETCRRCGGTGKIGVGLEQG
jgi:Ribonuclease G/E